MLILEGKYHIVWLLLPQSPLPLKGFPGASEATELGCKVGDMGLIPGLAGSPGEENGYPIQYSCLEDPMDRAA